MRRSIFFVIGILVVFSFICTQPARADFTPSIDGNIGEWPTDPSLAFMFQDNADLGWLAHRDIIQIWTTDDNDSGSNGNLYLAIEFAGDFSPSILGVDIDVYLNFDTDEDGIGDITIEITEGLPAGGTWAYGGSYIEVAIPYSALGLSHGNDRFGLSSSTSGLFAATDSAPDEGDGSNGFIVYDGTTGDGNIEPRSVRLISQRATVQRNGILIEWQTGSERHNAGFNIYKKHNGKWHRLNTNPIPGLGDSPFGSPYQWFDMAGEEGTWYRIEDVEYTGKRQTHRPIKAVAYTSPRVRFPMAVLPTTVAAKKRYYSIPSLDLPTTKPTLSAKDRLKNMFTTNPTKRFSLRKNNKTKLRIEVDTNNTQFITYDELKEAGFSNRAVDSRLIRLTQQGKPVPTKFESDGLWFKGNTLPDRYTDYSVVTASPGKKSPIGKRRVKGGCANPISTAPSVHTIEENNTYYIAAPSTDPFFWSSAYVGFPSLVDFQIPNYSTGPAEISVTLIGYGVLPGPDHLVDISINGISMGNFSWEGRNRTTISISVPSGLLDQNSNTMEVSLLNDEAVDIVLIDKIDVQYSRPLLASHEGLTFYVSENTCIQIDGLDHIDDYILLDISNPKRPKEIVGYEVIKNNSNYSIRYLSPPTKGRLLRHNPLFTETHSNRHYQLIAKSGMDIPTITCSMEYSTQLLKRSNRAEYLIITHPHFESAAHTLAEFHRAQDMHSMVVSTDDIYDTFNFGRPSPQAIKRLLQIAYKHWRTPPRFVLLMGGSSVDPMGYLGLGTEDYIPTPFYATHLNNYEAASDGWYVQGLRNVAIGRFAVESADEAMTVVNKTISWRQQDTTSIENTLFIADWDDLHASPGQGEFEKSAEHQIQLMIDLDHDILRLYRNHNENPVDDLALIINRGVDVINYHGHAYLSGWSSGPQLTTVDYADNLTNSHLFVLLSWSCFDGTFVGPWDQSLAWAFVRNPNGGAIAAVASASLSDPSAVEKLSYETTRQLIHERVDTIGEALYRAKQKLSASQSPGIQDTNASFNLLGDPATPNPWRF